MPPDSGAATTTRKVHFGRDYLGRLAFGWLYGQDAPVKSRVSLTRDSFGNLTQEIQEPLIDDDDTYKRTVTYTWDWVNPSGSGPITHNRLVGITYPSDDAANQIAFKYGQSDSTNMVEAYIGRATGLTRGGTDFIRYDMTGGGRTVQKTWGIGATVASTIQNATIALDFIGGSGTSAESSLDQFGRITNLTFATGTADTDFLHRYQYGYDKSGNRLFARIRQVDHDNDRSYLYGYDPLNRLTRAERGTLDTDNTSIAVGGTGRQWSLDVLGNWSAGDQTNGSVLDYTIGGSPSDPGFDVDDTLMLTQHHNVASNNEILSNFVDGSESSNFEYDPAGNLIDDANNKYIYDAFNRLVFVYRKSDYAPIARYDYDALGRRIRKTVANSGNLDTEWPGSFYYYDGQRVVEYYESVLPEPDHPTSPPNPPPPTQEKRRIVAETESATNVAPVAIDSIYAAKKDAILGGDDKSDVFRYSVFEEDSGTSAPETEFVLSRQFIYGLDYIDEQVAQLTKNPDTGAVTRYYAIQDANYNVVALANANGSVYRQFSYEPYGQLVAAEKEPAVPTLPMASINLATNPESLFSHHLFQGLWYDPETGFYYARNRTYNPPLARFNQRDPNGQALVLANAMAMNAQTISAFVSLSPGAQYNDGMHLYTFAGSNPVTQRDPSGRFTYAERLTVSGVVAYLAAVTTSAVSSFEAWALSQIGAAVAYSYVSTAAAIATTSTAMNSVDPAAWAALHSEFSNWMANQGDDARRHLTEGFHEYIGNSNLNPNDPEFWRRVMENSDLARALERNAQIQKDVGWLYDRVIPNLIENHGATREGIRTAMHNIKNAWNLGGADNVWVGLTGDVYHPVTGEFIGNLLRGF